MNIFDIIQVPFGYLMSFAYSLTHSYTIAILIFSLVVKVVLFPLGIKQQKNSQKQAALRPKEERIRKKYAGRTDRVTQQKMQQEIMELYQEEKYSPFGGCMPMLVQLVVIFCLYAVVTNPLTYMAHLSAEQVTQVHTVVTEMKPSQEPQKPQQTVPSTSVVPSGSSVAASTKAPQQPASYYQQIEDVQFINHNKLAFQDAFDKKYGAGKSAAFIEAIPQLTLFNVDLGVVPQSVGLLSIPALFALISMVTAYLGQIVTRKYTYQSPVNQESGAGTMRLMNVIMPLFSGYICFTMVPVAVTIYWIATNVLSPVQQILLSKMYKVPTFTPEELKEAEKALAKKEKGEKRQSEDTAPKRRSLVYDDDDEDVAPAAPATQKQGPKEKAKPEDSPIEKAPLKDEADK